MQFYMSSLSAVLLLGLTLSCGGKKEESEQVSTEAQQKDAKAGEAAGESGTEETTAAAEQSIEELQLRITHTGVTASLLDVLPADTLFYITAARTAQSLAAKKQSALYRLFEEPEVKGLIEVFQKLPEEAKFRDHRQEMIREIEKRMGIFQADHEPTPVRIELAIQGVDPFTQIPLPQVMMACELTKEWSAERVFRLIDTTLEVMAEMGYEGFKIVAATITLRDNTPGRVYFLQEFEAAKILLFGKGSRLYGALGENTANLLLANLAGPPPPQTLSRDSTFQKVKGRLEPHADRSLMYVNVKAIRNLALGLAAVQAPAQALRIQQMADSLGLKGIQAYGASTGLDGDGKSFQTRTFLAAPAPHRALRAALCIVHAPPCTVQHAFTP